MRVPFIKMQGLGNDFVVLDARECEIPALTADVARHLADRRLGIGCDQVIRLDPSEDDAADTRMSIWNADGSGASACGNASRAIAMLIGEPAAVRTDGGLIRVTPGDGVASVDMGAPRFEWQDVPLAYAMDTLSMPVAWEELENPGAVNVGNPHVVFAVSDCDAVQLDRLGPLIENDPLFPERVNVNVAAVESRERIRLRVWERGTGLTQACGTGACATAVALMRRGLVDRSVTVALPGGELEIAWHDGGPIVMTGAAAESFRGSFEWDEYS